MGKKSDIIFETAVKLFLKFGYSNTSMDEVAKEAGVSKQTIYNNFQNKENILKRIVELKSKQYYSNIENVETTAENFNELLENFLRNFVKLTLDRKLVAIHRIILCEMQNNPEIAHTFFLTGPAKTYVVLANLLTQANEKGIISIESPKRSADNIISMAKGQYYNEMLFGVRENITKEEQEKHLKNIMNVIQTKLKR